MIQLIIQFVHAHELFFIFLIFFAGVILTTVSDVLKKRNIVTPGSIGKAKSLISPFTIGGYILQIAALVAVFACGYISQALDVFRG